VADQHQRKTDALQKALRIQRCETARVSAVLESIPDGLVVQDLEGRVLMINDAARKLLGGQRAFRAARLHELTAVVADTLGPALAPGIYALGDPTRIPLEGRMIQAQAAAILSRPEQRIGTVIVLRDITADVEREQVRDALLDQLQQDTRPAAAQSYDSLAALAKEVTRNARSLQHVISELRDLSTFEPRDLQAAQQPLSLNDLLRHIVSEWQPFARSAQISLRVRFGPRGYHVLGDDRRLRWVIGNLVDNAIKYSPPRSSVILEIRVPEDPPHLAEIVIEDHGCGIAPDDLPHVFTRFYRGTPRGPGGAPLLKPGTGQGLFIAKRVIEAHGGQIALASRVGEGTTVAVRLPLTAPVALEIPADQQGSEAAPLPDGTPYDTVPLEPRRPPRDRPS
jgi:two-component system sensor histidine kinase ResE